ncbi:sulfatase-like hydrolase/transferase, partial [Pirellulaceae bacterium]|nr:sulfatase-like hydrolase/transferase [Pirellulaceae bacterium]
MRLFPLAILLLTSLTSITSFAAEPKIKSVLFLISDDLRASTLGCYGDQFCQTPNIDKLAEKGMLFERAYCQGTVCGPSRTSLMHSRYRGND